MLFADGFILVSIIIAAGELGKNKEKMKLLFLSILVNIFLLYVSGCPVDILIDLSEPAVNVIDEVQEDKENAVPLTGETYEDKTLFHPGHISWSVTVHDTLFHHQISFFLMINFHSV